MFVSVPWLIMRKRGWKGRDSGSKLPASHPILMAPPLCAVLIAKHYATSLSSADACTRFFSGFSPYKKPFEPLRRKEIQHCVIFFLFLLPPTPSFTAPNILPTPLLSLDCLLPLVRQHPCTATAQVFVLTNCCDENLQKK